MIEKTFLLREAEMQKIINYILSVPTGTLPGQRLADVLNLLNQVESVDAALLAAVRRAMTSE